MDYGVDFDDGAGIIRSDVTFGYIVGWNGEQFQIVRCGASREECEDCWGDVGEKYTGFWREPLEEIGTDFYRAIDVAIELADESKMPTLVMNVDGSRAYFEGETCAMTMASAPTEDLLDDIIAATGYTAGDTEDQNVSPLVANLVGMVRKYRFEVGATEKRVVWLALDRSRVHDYVYQSEHTGWTYLTNHPFIEAMIRAIYPIFIPPAFVHEEANRYNTYKGRVDDETRELFMSVLTVDVGALMSVLGAAPRTGVLESIVGTLAHELAHLAEGQSGLTYDGKWTFMGSNIMCYVPSGSEYSAEVVRTVVERYMFRLDRVRSIKEVDRATSFGSAEEALLEVPMIRQAAEAFRNSKTLRWGTRYEVDGLTGYVAIEVRSRHNGVDVKDELEQLGLPYVYVNPMFGAKFDAVAFYDVEMLYEDYINNSAPEDSE